MEQNRNLRVVNGFSKAARIISMILFVLIVVCAALTLLTLVISFFTPLDKLVNSATDLPEDLVEGLALVKEAAPFVRSLMTAAVIALVAYAVVLKMGHNYCKRELRDGTPFTEGGAKQLRTLGIVQMAVSFSVELVFCLFSKGFVKQLGALMPALAEYMGKYENIVMDGEQAAAAFSKASVRFSLGPDFWLGLGFLALSFLLMYGAELANRAGEDVDRPVPQPQSEWVPVPPHSAN